MLTHRKITFSVFRARICPLRLVWYYLVRVRPRKRSTADQSTAPPVDCRADFLDDGIGSFRPDHYSLITADYLLIPQIEELPHLAELLVARLKQFADGLIRQRRQLPVQHFIEKPCRSLIVALPGVLHGRT